MPRIIVSILLCAFISAPAVAATVTCYEAVMMTYNGGFLGVYEGSATHADYRDAKREAKDLAEEKCEDAVDRICAEHDCDPYNEGEEAYRCSSWGCKVQ